VNHERLWLNVDVANYLRVSDGWVRRHVRAGELPHLRFGKLVRFLPEEVRKFALDHHVERTAQGKLRLLREPVPVPNENGGES
jgi:excisionase family DNA binding protein